MRYFLSVILIFILAQSAFAKDTSVISDSVKVNKKTFDAGEMIIEHITDRHYWHLFSIDQADGSEKRVQINLPVILFSSGKGFCCFSFGRFEDGSAHYDGYHLDEHKHILADDGSKFYDISITKVVVQILISVILMLWIFSTVAKRYTSPNVKAPKGFQSAIEVVILFIRDEVARPMLGKKANKYLPYLLSVFFFIWINNMLGLLPASANVTGNIAITTTLALITFIILLFSSKSHYWKHIIAPPGVPIALYPIMIPVEILSVLTKPFALLIRLFANMTAGHLIVLSFITMIFIFAQKSLTAGIGVSIFSVAFSVFIYFLEILVAALQAYIFTILSALFIGQAFEEPEHHVEKHH